MKIRQKDWNGVLVTESVGDAVQRAIGQVGGHGYGQMEQLEVELHETQRFLFRLCDVLGDVLDKDDIYRLFDRDDHDEGEVDGRSGFFDSFEVIDE